MDTNKGYTLEMEDRGEYLYCIASGKKLTAQIASAYWNEIAGKCFETDCRKILIEKNFPETVGPTDMLHIADHVAGLLPGRYIAFLDRYKHSDINELGKKLARNRDIIFQVFNDITEAEKWLIAN